MKLRNLFYLFILTLTILSPFSACSDKDDEDPSVSPNPNPTEKTDDEITNEWIYDRMKRVYLWNEQLPASPVYTADPESFFYGILYNYGKTTGDRFSWIEEDTSKGTKETTTGTYLGFTYLPAAYFPTNENGQTSSIGFFVTSVKEGSDAEKQGLKRGQIIYKVDNATLTSSNYLTILKKSSFKLSIYNENGDQVTLPTIQANALDGSPIILSKVLTENNIKIGYLMYNAFERGPEDNTNDFTYDIELIETIKDLNSKGIKEFVLDLRYNPGGYLTSAIALASALVPNRDTKKVFLTEEYNKYFQDSLVNKYGKNALNEYFLDRIYGNVDIPKLNLDRLYIIATENSASASEAVINGLKPYMTIRHVGQTTVGKDKASITVKSDDKRILWQIQPLVSRLTNANGGGNYINGLEPNIEASEWEECYEMIDAYYIEDGKQVDLRVPVASPWKGGFKDLGDKNEPLLAEAIADITGVKRIKASKSTISQGKRRLVSPLKGNESRFKAIIDENKFENLNNRK